MRKIEDVIELLSPVSIITFQTPEQAQSNYWRIFTPTKMIVFTESSWLSWGESTVAVDIRNSLAQDESVVSLTEHVTNDAWSVSADVVINDLTDTYTVRSKSGRLVAMVRLWRLINLAKRSLTEAEEVVSRVRHSLTSRGFVVTETITRDGSFSVTAVSSRLIRWTVTKRTRLQAYLALDAIAGDLDKVSYEQ